MLRSLLKISLKNINKVQLIKNNSWSQHRRSVHEIVSRIHINLKNSPNNHLILTKSHHENSHAFSIVETLEHNLQSNKETDLEEVNFIESDEEFKNLTGQNFRSLDTDQVFLGFVSMEKYLIKHGILLSDTRLDNAVDGLLDCVEKLSDDQLFRLMDCLIKLPRCDGFQSHNLHDVWSALDDVCCWRLNKWDTETLLKMADRWYLFGLGKLCDFVHEVIEKNAKKPGQKLSKSQLVHMFFLMNVCRKRKVDFEYEVAVRDAMAEMSVDELAIVAMGFHKSACKIKLKEICTEMMRKAKEADDVHEVSMSAILKVIRMSTIPTLADQMYDFLDHLVPRMTNYSILCQLHTALLGSTIQMEHTASITIAARTIASNINDTSKVRLKDIERILLALTMFDSDTVPEFYRLAAAELATPQRLTETTVHPRCFAAALAYLAIKGVYVEELIDRVLDKQFVEDVYGKTSKMFPREIFYLDTSLSIDLPSYRGNRVDPLKRAKAVKYLVEWAPSRDQYKKLSVLDKLFLEVYDLFVEIVGGDQDHIVVDHVLPQYPKADIILCKNRETDQFVRPNGLDKYTKGQIMYPETSNANLTYFAVMVLGWNNTVRNTSRPLGLMNAKAKHLRKIGYVPIIVSWSDFLPINIKMKGSYLENLLDKAYVDHVSTINAADKNIKCKS